jgi:hypothetical protein
MNYIEYKNRLKNLDLNNNKFTSLVGIGNSTPSTNWRVKDEVPQTIGFIIELLEALPTEKRLVLVHEKLKEKMG